MMLEQIALAILGTSAAWLSQDARLRVARFACLCGLLAQPFWFVVEIAAGNWPVVWLCVVYSAIWIRGLLNFWIRPWQARRRVARVWRPRPPAIDWRALELRMAQRSRLFGRWPSAREIGELERADRAAEWDRAGLRGWLHRSDEPP